MYEVEILDEYDDDGTMVYSAERLREAVVGHKIVGAEQHGNGTLVITLDNGTVVEMVGEADCCAYTDVERFILHADKIDHIITGVGTTDGYTTWHIYADFGDVLELSVAWSSGNPFYYAYGFHIAVKEIDS